MHNFFINLKIIYLLRINPKYKVSQGGMNYHKAIESYIVFFSLYNYTKMKLII